ncbi:MAG: hypothetical protein JSU85_05125 [Candidatus Zixiibacteriota bacterium]|nr:MAG: hypothetical protein JSU85_05125 [candidate division Zixibacteria bacterium]
MKRTIAHQEARISAEKKGMNLENLTKLAISSGIFRKPGSTNENYGYSWVYNRLTRDDEKVSKKLIEFANTLKNK